MGSGGAKEKNKLLLEQQRMAQDAARDADLFKEEQYRRGLGRSDWAADRLMQDMWGAYGPGGSSESGGRGGGGGPAFEKYGWESETMPFYRDLMKTGGISEQERGALESSATSPVRGIWDALARNVRTGAAGAGRYGAGMSDLTRDAAYQASEANKSAFGDIAKLIAAGRERGAAGLTGLESEKRALELSERDKALAAARARAAAANAGREGGYREQMGIINALAGLGDTSLQWGGQQLAGVGEGRQSAESRVDETPLWMKAAASLAPATASAAAGAFTGGLAPIAGGLFKKRPNLGPVEDQLAG